jgi:hypothetical protein
VCVCERERERERVCVCVCTAMSCAYRKLEIFAGNITILGWIPRRYCYKGCRSINLMQSQLVNEANSKPLSSISSGYGFLCCLVIAVLILLILHQSKM